MVIGIHTFPQNKSLIYVIVREMLNFAVPLFLVISGIFATKSYKKSCNYLSYLKKQIPKVYIPTLIWSLPWFLIATLTDTNSINNILNLLLCGYSIFYFVVLIIQMYLLLPVYQNIKLWGVVTSSIITTISVMLLTYVIPTNLPLTIYVGPCVYWLLFFAIGAYYSDKHRDYSLLMPSLIILIGFITQILEHDYLISLGRNGIGIKLSSWFYSTGAVLLLISEKIEKSYARNKVNTYIKTIGDNSFGIYLTHMLVLIVVGRFLPNVWSLKWIITLVVTFFFIIITKRIFPLLSNKYLGFKQ